MNSFTIFRPVVEPQVAHLCGSSSGDDNVILKSLQLLTYLSVFQFLSLILLIFDDFFCVENIGVEPMTSCLQSRRSSQLS